MRFVWQLKDWPRFTWDADALAGRLSETVLRQGRFLGELSAIGFENRKRAGFESISDEIVNSAAIEGEEFLRRPNVVIESIAGSCGFQSTAHLRVLFRRATGLSLRAWREAR